jgi:predicted alpha/beta hydrolase
MPHSQHTIRLSNDASLVLRLFAPTADPRAAVIVPSAMGVVQNYYARFAEWLSSQGFLVATFDYRGIGLSAPRSPSDIGARHIGHFGFFRPQFEQTLWPLVREWLK